MRARALLTTLAALSGLAAEARADAPTDPPAEAPADAPAEGEGEPRGGPAPPKHDESLAPASELAPGEKRPKLDYDGRPKPAVTAEDALWVPRVLLYPLYVATEYFIRLPLAALGEVFERYDLLAALLSQNRLGAIPTAFVDFGFRPSVGVYFFVNDLAYKGNDLRANLSFGGIHFWRAGVAWRFPFDTPYGVERARSFFQVETDFLTRGDLLFWGIGPRSKEEDLSNYGITTAGGGLRLHLEPWRGRIFEAWLTGRWTTTDEGSCRSELNVVDENFIARICDPPTMRRRILDGVFEPPPRYGRPYATVKAGARAVLDSRDKRPASGTGVALDASIEHVTQLDTPALGQWLNYGATAAAFIDVTGTQRVLSLALAARFQDPFGERTVVPFTELVGAKHIEDVPDVDMMRGFQPGRLLGESAIVATLEYRWPVWAFLDGTLQLAVGETFLSSHLEDFDPELLRFSFVGGLRSPNHRDHSFNFLVGFGTNTIEEGAEPSSLRLLVGGTTGF
ncbi:MAG: hypothetical protein U0271_43025 [Polyangiaceae bacterium]